MRLGREFNSDPLVQSLGFESLRLRFSLADIEALAKGSIENRKDLKNLFAEIGSQLCENLSNCRRWQRRESSYAWR
jgi:hypothetical protein